MLTKKKKFNEHKRINFVGNIYFLKIFYEIKRIKLG